MLKSIVLGKTYKTRANYETQIRNHVSKQQTRINQVEEELNQEKSFNKRIQLNSERNALQRSIREAINEPFLIIESEE